MTNILVFDDIIDIEYQEKIKSILIGRKQYKDYYFPWYFIDDVTKARDIDSQNRPALYHSYVKDPSILDSEFHDLFTDLIQSSCSRLNVDNVRVIKGRSFCQFPLNLKETTVDTPHLDGHADHFVMLYYVCDSDGDTIIYNEKVKSENYTIQQRITPKQGRVVLFDGAFYHTAEQPLNNIRCVVNYNLENYVIPHKETK